MVVANHQEQEFLDIPKMIDESGDKWPQRIPDLVQNIAPQTISQS